MQLVVDPYMMNMIEIHIRGNSKPYEFECDNTGKIAEAWEGSFGQPPTAREMGAPPGAPAGGHGVRRLGAYEAATRRDPSGDLPAAVGVCADYGTIAVFDGVFKSSRKLKMWTAGQLRSVRCKDSKSNAILVHTREDSYPYEFESDFASEILSAWRLRDAVNKDAHAARFPRAEIPLDTDESARAHGAGKADSARGGTASVFDACELMAGNALVPDQPTHNAAIGRPVAVVDGLSDNAEVRSPCQNARVLV
jgi:hypothetical protein